MRFVARPATPWGAILLGIGMLAGAFVALLHLDRLPFAICTFKAITGLPCPTCGSTRAAAELARLHLLSGFSMNPLAVVAIGLLGAWGLADLLLIPRGRALGIEVGPSVARGLRAGALVAFVANWAYLIATGR